MRVMSLQHVVAFALATGAAFGTVQAGEPRDPMRPPAAATPRAPGAPAAAPALPAVRHLLWVNGQRFVVDGNRRRGVGDWLGDARIEGIEDSAVVVRRNGQTQRLPLFAGVTKRPAADPVPDAATAAAVTPAPVATRVPPPLPKVRVAARTQP